MRLEEDEEEEEEEEREDLEIYVCRKYQLEKIRSISLELIFTKIEDYI